MQNYEYRPQNICAKKITFNLEGNIISDVKFYGGCNGNTQGISKLLEGADARETISRLEGVVCGNRGTSCPAELARALKTAMTRV